MCVCVCVCVLRVRERARGDRDRETERERVIHVINCLFLCILQFVYVLNIVHLFLDILVYVHIHINSFINLHALATILLAFKCHANKALLNSEREMERDSE